MPLGTVLDINGIRAICRFDRAALSAGRNGLEGRLSAATSVGAMCKVDLGSSLLLGTLADLRTDRDTPDAILAELELVGEGQRNADGCLADFRIGISAYPQPGDEVDFATPADLAQIFAPPEQPWISLGTVHLAENTPAPILFDRLLGRHFALVGSSGTGKSTAASLLLSRIIAKAPHAHVLVLDPHGEYASAFGNAARVWNVDNLQLPYWAMDLAEHCAAFITSQGAEATVDRNILAKCLQVARARNVRISEAARVTADSPIAYRVEDLIDAIEQEAGRLEKLADGSRYTQLRLSIEHYFADPRYRFIFNHDWAAGSLESLIGEILRIPDSGQPISIVDLAGVPTEIVNVVVSVMARLTLDFAIRSPRERRAPTLLLCEEAHRYLPRVPTIDTDGVRLQLERIAREGRKYGVALGIVTQRPSELSEVVLSQLGTIISLRLNNQNDQDQIRACIAEGARSLVSAIPALRNRECIASGEGVPVPMRILIDQVPVGSTPDSHDLLYSERWQDGTIGRDDVTRTVAGWRNSG